MATRSMSRLAQLCSRVFFVEVAPKTEPLYFSLSLNPKKSKNEELQELFGGGKLYSLCALSDDRVQGARSHEQLKHTLTQLSPHCDLIEMASFLPDVKHSLVRGFFLRDNSTPSSAELAVNQLRQKVCVMQYNCAPSGEFVCSSMPEDSVSVGEKYYVIPAAAPEYHPSTLNIINSDVFYRMEDAYTVLQECYDVIPESKTVLELVEQQRKDCKIRDKRFPVIVIEGLDATGKTTLTSSLQKELGAVLLKSPPQCLFAFRQRFDAEPPLIRRAFYALGNYISAAQIARESSNSPVIVDRYWHSTAAYAIATAVSGKVENLPAVGSEIYNWPTDLLRPSLVLLLTVSPQERLRRLTHRGLDKTEEEKQLELNHLFRQKVEEAYKRIQDPSCMVVDASPSPNEVLQNVLCLIKNNCHL